MELLDDGTHPVDLRTTPLHLGLGCRARPVDGFAFDPAVLEAYGAAVADDGAEGRLLVLIDEDGPGGHWESHPAGDEVIICLSGTLTVVREVAGHAEEVVLRPGQATVNPAGVWHTVDADGPARILTLTPGLGTEHRPRATAPAAG